MTVKILTQAQKDAVVTIFNAKTRTQKEIAGFLRCSERTINRVLNEAGVAPVKETMTASAKRVMTLLYENKITVEQLEKIVTAISTANKILTATQTVLSNKSPVAHNGKQYMLPLSQCSTNVLHCEVRKNP